MSFIQARPLATHNFYAPVHKGLRLALTHLLTRLGVCDASCSQGLETLLDDLRTQLALSEHHLANEDTEVHTALEARAPGATARLVQDHDHHRHTFGELEGMIRDVERAPHTAKPALLHRLYLRFSVFVADDFAHMAEEEQLMLPILQSLFSDEELMGIEDRIMSHLTPQEMVAFGRMIIPAAGPAERIAMLSGLRANAPAEAFEAILELAARPTLAADEFNHLLQGLGLKLAEAA